MNTKFIHSQKLVSLMFVLSESVLVGVLRTQHTDLKLQATRHGRMCHYEPTRNKAWMPKDGNIPNIASRLCAQKKGPFAVAVFNNTTRTVLQKLRKARS